MFPLVGMLLIIGVRNGFGPVYLSGVIGVIAGSLGAICSAYAMFTMARVRINLPLSFITFLTSGVLLLNSVF